MGNSSRDDSATDGDASSGEAKPSNSSLYSDGEKILAYHGPRIYEAKASNLSHLFRNLHFLYLRALVFQIMLSVLFLFCFSCGILANCGRMVWNLRLGFKICNLQSLIRFLFFL
jgi:hypothetical protein